MRDNAAQNREKGKRKEDIRSSKKLALYSADCRGWVKEKLAVG